MRGSRLTAAVVAVVAFITLGTVANSAAMSGSSHSSMGPEKTSLWTGR